MRLDKSKFDEKFNALKTKLTELSTTATTDINIIKASVLELITEIKGLSDETETLVGAGNGEFERLENENAILTNNVTELQTSNADLVNRLGVIALKNLENIENNNGNDNNNDNNASYDELIKRF